MKKVIAVLIISFLLTKSFAQKTIHDPNVAPRNVSGFHAIHISDGIDLFLSSGDEAVAVSAKDEAYRDKIKTEVTDGVLRISYERKGGMNIPASGARQLRAYVSFKTLDMLTATGGCDIKVDGTIKANTLYMYISSGSDFDGAVDVNELTIRQNSGSDINISGRAGTATIDASSGSDLDGYDLITDICVVKATSGSDVSITVNKELTAEAGSAGDVTWKGKATVKKSRASGAGSISHRS